MHAAKPSGILRGGGGLTVACLIDTAAILSALILRNTNTGNGKRTVARKNAGRKRKGKNAGLNIAGKNRNMSGKEKNSDIMTNKSGKEKKNLSP